MLQSKINVLFLCGNLSYAGAQRQLFELAKGLNNTHNVIVCSIRADISLIEEFNKQNIQVIILKLRAKNLYKVIIRMLRLIKKHQIDIIYSFLDTANIYNILLKLINPNINIILSERSSQSHSRIKKIAYFFLKNYPDGYIANSYAGKQHLADNFSIYNTYVVHNGVDYMRFENLSNNSFILPEKFDGFLKITMVARIKYQKNYELFLDVAEKICSKYSHVVFIAVGDEPDAKSRYKNKIKRQHNLMMFKDRVLFLGARKDIPHILLNSDISILTSLSEGCSNTILESMLAKCPLLITDVGDNKRIVSERNHAFISETNNKNDMINKLSILIESPELRKKIGDANYIYAFANFTIEKMVEKTNSVFSQVIHEKLS